MTTPRRAARRLAGLAVVLAVGLTACTTATAGRGRPASGPAVGASRSATPSDSASPSSTASAVTTGPNALPSGAPVATATRYPDVSPLQRAYLYARDATYAPTAMTATGRYTFEDVDVQVDGRFGFDSDSFADCTFTVGGASAEVRAVGETTVARGPAAFWTAVGLDAGIAAQAADAWVAVTDVISVAGACGNNVFFLDPFQPQAGDQLSSSVADGGRLFVIDDSTSSTATGIDHDTGRFAEIRTAAGTVTLGYPATLPTAPTLPAAADIRTVAGI